VVIIFHFPFFHVCLLSFYKWIKIHLFSVSIRFSKTLNKLSYNIETKEFYIYNFPFILFTSRDELPNDISRIRENARTNKVNYFTGKLHRRSLKDS